MYSRVCAKLFDNFEVSWDPELLTKNFSKTSSHQHAYRDPSGSAHWQVYEKTNVSFGRNFYKNHVTECREVADKLKEIQAQILPSDNPLVESFRARPV